MQVIDASDFFLRVVVYDLIHKEKQNQLRFRIIPMVHIGEKAFYEAAYENLAECDHIIYEGISSKLFQGTFRMMSHMAKKLDLVEQRQHLNLKKLPANLIHGDLAPAEVKPAWQKVNKLDRLSFRFLMPVSYLYHRTKITRKSLSRSFKNSQDIKSYSYRHTLYPKDVAEYFILNQREQKLFKTINAHIKEFWGTPTLTGIVWGAGHVHPILYHLEQRGYQVKKASFLTVYHIN